MPEGIGGIFSDGYHRPSDSLDTWLAEKSSGGLSPDEGFHSYDGSDLVIDVPVLDAKEAAERGRAARRSKARKSQEADLAYRGSEVDSVPPDGVVGEGGTADKEQVTTIAPHVGCEAVATSAVVAAYDERLIGTLCIA